MAAPAGDRIAKPVTHAFFIWLLSFMLNDIGDLPGPDYNTIQKSHVPEEKLNEANNLATQLVGVEK